MKLMGSKPRVGINEGYESISFFICHSAIPRLAKTHFPSDWFTIEFSPALYGLILIKGLGRRASTDGVKSASMTPPSYTATSRCDLRI